MRPSILSAAALATAVFILGACSSKSDSAASSHTSPSTASSAASDVGTAQDKAACETLSAELSTWGTAFADAADGLPGAAGDVTKTKVIVDEVKGLNTKTANDLHADAGKTSDAIVKKVANDLATTLEKVNTQLDANEIAQNPDKLTAIFSSPEYVSSAEAYEKACGSP